MNHKRLGSGPPIIIMHGLFGMLDNWMSFGRKLAEHFTVYLVDLRNHGRSEHAEEMTYEDMAEDVIDLIREMDMDRPHLMGHSMGGKVAMYVALNFEESIRRLIIVDIAPKAYPPGHLEIMNVLMNLDLNEMQNRADAFKHIYKGVRDERITGFLMKNIGRSKEGTLQWKMNLRVIYDHYLKIIDLVGAPWSFNGKTLFVKGGLSDYIQEQDIPLIIQLFPKAIIKSIDGAGHWVHADQPDRLYVEVMNFLGESTQ